MTDPRLKIPALALLSLSFTGCGDGKDGIAGKWRATQYEGEAYPQVETNEDTKLTYEVFLEIGEDLKGELQHREHGVAPEAELKVGYDLEIEVEAMAPHFLIHLVGYGGYGEPSYPGDGSDPEEYDDVFLDCELSGDVLECVENGPEPGLARFVRAD